MNNYDKFRSALVEAYKDLFATDPYAYIAASRTPEQLADKMVASLKAGTANKDGEGIKRACKACGIKQTYKAIVPYLNEVQS